MMLHWHFEKWVVVGPPLNVAWKATLLVDTNLSLIVYNECALHLQASRFHHLRTLLSTFNNNCCPNCLVRAAEL